MGLYCSWKSGEEMKKSAEERKKGIRNRNTP